MAGWAALLAAAACAFAVGLVLDTPLSAKHGLAEELRDGRFETVDLSVALSPDVGQMVTFFSGLSQDDLPDGEAWAVERLNISTHSGTHVDAPYHFATTMDKDKRAITVDEVEKELERVGHALQPFDIVVVNTRAGQRYGHSDYLLAGCGMGRNATLWLCERGVKVMGTDAWSWDAPFAHTARRYAESRDASIIWEGHKAGRDCGYAQIEKLANLDKIPSTGFFVAVFPVKIAGASAGWTRAVALVPK
eukprot:jgi/Chlat1/8561/Chrsp82S07979